MKGIWVPHDVRDGVVDFVKRWSERAEIAAKKLLGWIGLAASKFHSWKGRYGKVVHTHKLVSSLRGFICEVLDLDPVPEDLDIPNQGPSRTLGGPGGGKGKGDGEGGQKGGKEEGAGGMAMGASLGFARNTDQDDGLQNI